MKAFAKTIGLVALALLVAGCARDKPLPGERIAVRDALTDGSTVAGAGEYQGPRDVPFSAPRAVNLSSWTHRGGSALHRVAHPALRSAPVLIWTADIGGKETRKARITADPVVEAGRIFTLDSHSLVMAHSTAGAALWSRSLVPGSDRGGDVSGGGLALGAGKLFVTTGFGDIYALAPQSGAVLWRQKFDAPVSGAPTVQGDLVYVSSRDGRGFAVNVGDGRLEWEVQASPSRSAAVNGAGPAVTGRHAIFPFSSTELFTALRLSGLRVWSDFLAGKRRGYAFAGVTDIAADPVVAGNTVYAGSPSGQTAAFDIDSGERLWSASEGAMGPVWVDGGSVFAVNDIQQLVRLNASTGEVIWKIDLPRFKNKRPRRYRDVYAHYGPVLAGGRLIVASDDGYLRSFDPRNGALLGAIEMPGGATTSPVIVNGTLYIVTRNGKLAAFR
ncbi:PQQ-binding-like beta-propeller repeat protein [Tropicimonas sp.]|uniref:PQQ-like beta-propeller repeat protein n=1 Tax=Tropicimonas sp. TaxID=2067044 RepID=UPI003A84AFB1